MQCPSCNHIPLAGNQPDPNACPKCGVPYAESIRKNATPKAASAPVLSQAMAPHVKKVMSEYQGAQPVVILDLNMSFNSMVWFMVKWVVASIPAMIILGFLLIAFIAFFGGFLGFMGR